MDGFCHRCGDCCDGIYMSQSPDDFREVLEGEPDHPDVTFIVEHWHLVGSEGDEHIYRCDMFDAETRLCTAHDDRPPVCRDFPWYGREPSASSKNISKRCGYWYDLPADERPDNVLPLTEVA